MSSPFAQLLKPFLASSFALLSACSESNEPAPPIEPAAGPTFITNTIRFETASEDGLFGFVLFRGDSEEGPFEKVNDPPVEAGGYTDLPRKYEIADETAIAGQTYFYFIESIGYDNLRKRFSPVFPYETPVQ